MTPLPVWLAEKAETLRKWGSEPVAVTDGDGRPVEGAYALTGDSDRSLADLIDGMLAEHAARTLGNQRPSCRGCGRWMDCPTLKLLAQHVATILGESIPDES